MAAGRIVIPGWMPALDSNGAPIPNAQIYFYLNGTTTLATVYGDEALTTPIANPVEANSSGQFPEIWADDANLFSVSVDAPFGPPGIPFSFDSIGPATASAVIETATDVATDVATAVVAGKANINGDNTNPETFRLNINAEKKTGDIIASGFTFNNSTTPVATANSAILQAAFNAIPSGGYGVVRIAVPDGTAAADLYFNDGTRPDQGTRSVTLMVPKGITIQGSAPVVSDVRQVLVRVDYRFSASAFPVNAASIYRPEFLPGNGGAWFDRDVFVHSPTAQQYIATRKDYLIAENSFTGLIGNTNSISRVMGMSGTGGAFWHDWVLFRTPTSPGSGLPGSPVAAQTGSFLGLEMNPQNLCRQPTLSNTIETSDYLVGGTLIAPECEDYDNFGQRVGFNIVFAHASCVSPVPNQAGRYAQTIWPYYVGPNAVAPGGSAFYAYGSTRGNPGTNAALGARGGINNVNEDPAWWGQGKLFFKSGGLDFAEAVFANNIALRLGNGHTIAMATSLGVLTLVGAFSTDSTIINARENGGSVFLGGPAGARMVAEFQDVFTARGGVRFVFRPESGQVVMTATGDTNLHMRITPLGTGATVVTGLSGRNYASDALAAAGGIPVDGLYRDGSGNVKVRLV